MISAKVKFNLNLPVFQLQKDLKKIADRVIIVDIADRMKKQVDLRGSRYPSNTEATTRIKRKKGLRREVLFAEGKLFRAPFSKNVRRNAVKISLRSDREDVGNILQNKGVKTKRGKKRYLFFGISQEAERDALNFMRNEIRKDIDRGERRITK